MPDIRDSIVLSKEALKAIESVVAAPTYTFRDWSNDLLKGVRSEIRNFYRTQQRAKCAYCRNVITKSALGCHVEHIVPKSKYVDFIFTPKNLCVICPDCNEIKREKEVADKLEQAFRRTPKIYPRSGSAFLIYHPHFDNYEDHIIQVDGYYIDRSDKGANTIKMCTLNRRIREFGYEPSLVSSPGKLELMYKILNSGKINEILALIED
ncbi:hypothetical protein HL670_01661 [Serratia plymuthica]|uniref:HNH endonuclease n=1 Tax=Serratia plymuthica TaxID=82996 RepID=UPI0007882613|nr:HNH endonuclease [Serratia plymuthica]QJW54780.1 hypothetical protein HL670_01661 [Serratia plymuthica]